MSISEVCSGADGSLYQIMEQLYNKMYDGISSSDAPIQIVFRGDDAKIILPNGEKYPLNVLESSCHHYGVSLADRGSLEKRWQIFETKQKIQILASRSWQRLLSFSKEEFQRQWPERSPFAIVRYCRGEKLEEIVSYVASIAMLREIGWKRTDAEEKKEETSEKVQQRDLISQRVDLKPVEEKASQTTTTCAHSEERTVIEDEPES